MREGTYRPTVQLQELCWLQAWLPLTISTNLPVLGRLPVMISRDMSLVRRAVRIVSLSRTFGRVHVPHRPFTKSANHEDQPAPRAQMQPRTFPTSGFETVPASVKFEEERLPYYDRHMFYPVQIGEVLNGHYQVVAKLGWGTTSTVWLAHDLELVFLTCFPTTHRLTCEGSADRYAVLKVHVHPMPPTNELEIDQHIKSIDEDHPGRSSIRLIESTFEIKGSRGMHVVFVLPPLGVSLGQIQQSSESVTFGRGHVILALNQVVVTLNYLHTVPMVTHTGESPLPHKHSLTQVCLLSMLTNPTSRCARRTRWQSPRSIRRRIKVWSFRRERDVVSNSQEDD